MVNIFQPSCCHALGALLFSGSVTLGTRQTSDGNKDQTCDLSVNGQPVPPYQYFSKETGNRKETGPLHFYTCRDPVVVT